MILPTKRLNVDNSLLGLGAHILELLDRPKTVSRIWDEFKARSEGGRALAGVTYEWFVLAIDLLFTIGAVEQDDGELVKDNP